MATGTIVKHLDIIKDPMPGFGSGRIQIGIDLLDLEGMEKGLGTGIVVTIPLAAHALSKLPVLQDPSERPAGILAPPIRMEEHAFARLRPLIGHIEGIQDQLLTQRGLHRPADDVASEQIYGDGEFNS